MALLAQFDDIPIHELHKADGYQIRASAIRNSGMGNNFPSLYPGQPAMAHDNMQQPANNPYGNDGLNLQQNKTAEVIPEEKDEGPSEYHTGNEPPMTSQDYLPEEVENLTLLEQVNHSKWKVRMHAFKKINQLFENYDGKSKDGQGEMYGDINDPLAQRHESPFETYGYILQEIIKDTNLTAQYEGLTCLYSFVKYGTEKDVKSVTFNNLEFLLDKI